MKERKGSLTVYCGSGPDLPAAYRVVLQCGVDSRWRGGRILGVSWLARWIEGTDELSGIMENLYRLGLPRN